MGRTDGPLAASLGVIGSSLAPCLVVQVRADFRDARAAEAILHFDRRLLLVIEEPSVDSGDDHCP